jgi:hypothetical protein
VAGIFINTGCLSGIGKLPALALYGWYFGWYFWYCIFWGKPSFDDLAGTLFLKNLAGTLLGVSHALRSRNTYSYVPSCVVL